MFFRRNRTGPTRSTALNFLLTYFIVGLLILSLAFVYYTKQILKLNRDLEALVGPLADLAAALPGVKEPELRSRLEQIVKQSLHVSRLSFIITDTNDQIKIVWGVDEAIERKLEAKPTAPLSSPEQSRLKTILARMKASNKPKDIKQSTPSGFFYFGEAAPEAIDRIPFVITDADGHPQKWAIWGKLTSAKRATSDQYAQAEMLVRRSKEKGLYVPFTMVFDDRQGYFYYQKTSYYGLIAMPIILVMVFATFLIVGFLSYQRIKSFEQAAIWAGLAKETGHQLGTPVSSLMGWVELLVERNKRQRDETSGEIYADMQKDLSRLQKIADRFGTIGSYPQKTAVNINSVIADMVAYFRKRLPSRSRQIEIRVMPGDLPEMLANPDLLQWVFENLTRNSLDAIDKEFGLIQIDSKFDEKNQRIIIQHRDNGQGIKRSARRKIFQPGMTTKTHGWGLGLTLARRIIEQYHHGKIRLAETDSDGTMFEIILPVEPIDSAQSSPKRERDSAL